MLQPTQPASSPSQSSNTSLSTEKDNASKWSKAKGVCVLERVFSIPHLLITFLFLPVKVLIWALSPSTAIFSFSSFSSAVILLMIPPPFSPETQPKRRSMRMRLESQSGESSSHQRHGRTLHPVLHLPFAFLATAHALDSLFHVTVFNFAAVCLCCSARYLSAFFFFSKEWRKQHADACKSITGKQAGQLWGASRIRHC